MDKLKAVSAAQKERVRFIDYHSFLLGKIVRRDLQDKFGIAEAAATRDFCLYNKLAPQNLIYQPSIRSYVVSGQFTPVFDYSVSETLKTLAKDFENISTFTHEEEFRLGTTPSINLISTITRAIHLNRVIECEYFSTSSGKNTKVLAPHCLFDTGLHWYVRGYDKSKKRFADFVLSRILSAKMIDELPNAHEVQVEDSEYNNIISLAITAHKNLDHPETIEFDYGMENGQLVKQVRASFAGYLLRRWNVDCSLEGILEGNEYQLRLLNAKELKDIDSLYFAPGFSSDQNH